MCLLLSLRLPLCALSQDARKALSVGDSAGVLASLGLVWKRMAQCLASSPTDPVKMIVKPDWRDLGDLIATLKSQLGQGGSSGGGSHGGSDGGGDRGHQDGGRKPNGGGNPGPGSQIPGSRGGGDGGNSGSSEGRFGGGPLVQALRQLAIDYCTWEAAVGGNSVAISFRHDPRNPLCSKKHSRVHC